MPTATGIKVGNAFIEIHPKMSDGELLKALAKIDEQVKASYRRRSDMTRAYNRAAAKLEETLTAKYGRAIEGRTAYHAEGIKARKKLSEGELRYLARGLEAATAEVRRAEKEKTASAEREARLRERIAHQEQILTTRYGAETAAAYQRRLQEMRAAGTRLHLARINQAAQLSAAEQAAARATARAQEQAAQQAARAHRAAAQEAALSSRRTATAARAQWTAVRDAEITSVRRMLEAQRAQKTEFLRNERAKTAAVVSELRKQVAANEAALARIAALHKNSVGAVMKRWDGWGTKVTHFGHNISELGQTIVNGVVAPLGMAGAAITALGVQSADAMISAQTALRGMGLDVADVNTLIGDMTEYGLKTPYSVEDMQQYGTRYVRANLAHDPDANSSDPAKRSRAQSHSTDRAVDMVQMIGDMAAYGGITDPASVSRGMYAIAVMQDMNRAGLRNVKQLEAATGVPANELAQMLGFQTRAFTEKELAGKKKQIQQDGLHLTLPKTYEASAQMMDFMANARETGGVAGEDVITALLGRWNDPAHNIKGSAERMSAATISGRISNMAEQAKFNLGRIFAKPDPQTGQIEYTGLGQVVMGRKTPKYSWDRHGEKQLAGYTYEGGLLQKAGDIGTSLMGTNGNGLVPKGLQVFFESIAEFTDWAHSIVQYLKDHPGLQDAVLQGAKIAAAAAPFVIALGVATKLFGRIVKILSPVAGLLAGAFKGLKGTAKLASQVTGVGSRQVRDAAAAAGPDSTFRDRYRARRTALNGGDERSLGRRTLDRRSGENSGTARLTADNSQLKAAIREAENKVSQLGREITTLGNQKLNRLSAEFADSRHSVQQAATRAKQAEHDAKTAAEHLGDVKLAELRSQLGQTSTSARALTSTTRGATTEAHTLGRQSMSATTAGVKDLGKAASSTRAAIGQLNKNAANLSQRTFTRPIAQMDKLHTSATHAHSEIRKINGLKLDDVTKEVKQLKSALDDAKREASSLSGHINEIEGSTGRGKSSGGSGKSTPRKHAHGGVLPGYAPGVDSVPAILSPGEGILRPEVTAAIGTTTIDAWNQAAVRGQLSRHAHGGIAGRFGLDKLQELLDLQNPWPLARSAIQDMTFDATSDAVGGDARTGMLSTGDRASQWAGKGIAEKYDGAYNFVMDDSWKFMKRLPTVVGQAIGVVGGTFAPILGQYFHDDVWKGTGNIVERGNRFLDDTFSTKTLANGGKNLVGGLLDSVTSLIGGAKLITDPIGSTKDAFSAIWQMGKTEIDYVIDMVKAVKSVVRSPKAYAGRVISGVMSEAKEAMPNTKGLFDFSDSDRLDADMPDITLGLGSPAPTGTAVTRWRPTVQTVLRQLGLSQSYTDLVLHRIQVESGGNPRAINLTDINAKMGHPSQGLMQTIPSTFASYAGPYRSLGITSPLASIYAGLNYATHRYGSKWPSALSGLKGYWQGTASASPGLALVGERGPELIDFRGGERVYDATDTSAVTSPRYEIHIHEARSEPTSQAVLRALRYAEVMHGMN